MSTERYNVVKRKNYFVLSFLSPWIRIRRIRIQKVPESRSGSGSGYETLISLDCFFKRHYFRLKLLTLIEACFFHGRALCNVQQHHWKLFFLTNFNVFCYFTSELSSGDLLQCGEWGVCGLSGRQLSGPGGAGQPTAYTNIIICNTDRPTKHSLTFT